MIAPNLPSSLVNLFKPENKSQFKIFKDPKSIWMQDYMINTSKPVTLYCNMLIFRDTINFFNLDGDLLKTRTNYNFNVDHSKPQAQQVFLSLEKKWNLILSRKDEKVLRTVLFQNYLNRLLSWLLGLPQYFFINWS